MALDLLFPRRCPFCGKISDGACRECAEKLPYVRQPMCFRCGRPLENEEDEYCLACRTRKMAYTQGRALYLYKDAVRESLHAVKYQNKREYLDFFASDMALRLGPAIRRWNPQVIIPVPMHKRAQRKRGYNQAELLAKRLGERMQLPVCADGLRKIRQTANQKELDYRERRRNLKNAFAVNSRYLTDGAAPWQSVLLVDDVYTTGSTVQEAAGTLAGAGVEKIYFAALCIVPENL